MLFSTFINVSPFLLEDDLSGLSAADSNNYSFLCLPLPLVINFAFGEKTKGKFNCRRWNPLLTGLTRL